MRRPTIFLCGVAAFMTPVLAASPDAWEAFRLEVRAACLAAAEPLIETPVAAIDPFGSQNYGLALVEGKAKGAEADIRAICVFDKQTKKAEIGGELGPAE